MIVIVRAIIVGDFIAQDFQMNRQRIERRFYFMGKGARGDGKPLHRRRHADILALFHDQSVDQIQAGADFVVTAVLRPGRVGSRLGLAQGFADQPEAPSIKRGGKECRDQRDHAA